MKIQPLLKDEVYTEPGLTQGEQYLLKQPIKVTTRSIQVPDLTSHSESTTVGDAVERLIRFGISSDQIKFYISLSHTNFGEIIGQDPMPDTEMDSNQEIQITVGTWAKDSRHRFSFFASEQTQSTERALDADQLDVWETCKNDVVHLFAALDQYSGLNSDHLLSFFARRMLSDLLNKDFKLSRKPLAQEALCTVQNLISGTKWAAIYHALRIRSRLPFNLIDFKTLICGYFKLSLDDVDIRQQGTHVLVTLRTHGTNLDQLQSDWIKFLFCPIDMTMSFSWKPRVEPKPKLEPQPSPPSKLIKLTRRCLSFLIWSGRLLAVEMKKIAFWIWSIILAAIRWVLKRFSHIQIIATSFILVALLGIYIYLDNLPHLPTLTHKNIQSIGGMLPIEAIKKGLVNASYMADGKPYQPMTREAAYRYRQEGIASYYGKEKAGLTVSGSTFDPGGLTAAHERLPIPSTVRVTNLENRSQITLIVNDRGPFTNGRIINLSEAAARSLGFHNNGTARVLVEGIDSKEKIR